MVDVYTMLGIEKRGNDGRDQAYNSMKFRETVKKGREIKSVPYRALKTTKTCRRKESVERQWNWCGVKP